MIPLLLDLPSALIAGYLGTEVMKPVSAWLCETESQPDREREDTVRPGRPYRIAALEDRLAARAGPVRDASKTALVFCYDRPVLWA